MSTNARIGIKLADDSIVSVYHHWDGYPEWLGRMLERHYNTKESVTDLIDGGDMSSCYTNSGFNNEPLGGDRPLYYTMRGDELTPPQVAESLTEYLEQSTDCGGEYAYVFDNGEWFCYNTQTWGDSYGQIVEIPEPFPTDHD